MGTARPLQNEHIIGFNSLLVASNWQEKGSTPNYSSAEFLYKTAIYTCPLMSNIDLAPDSDIKREKTKKPVFKKYVLQKGTNNQWYTLS